MLEISDLQLIANKNRCAAIDSIRQFCLMILL